MQAGFGANPQWVGELQPHDIWHFGELFITALKDHHFLLYFPTLSIFGSHVPFPASSFLTMPLAACMREHRLNYSTSKDGRRLSLRLRLSGSAFLVYRFSVNLTFDPEAPREEMSSGCSILNASCVSVSSNKKRETQTSLWKRGCDLCQLREKPQEFGKKKKI